jgi:endonuclease YncB( thermonuclease family)
MPVVAAAALTCLVIGISDGDTLKARCEELDGKINITVRLAEIDAPEKGQAWGTRSRQHLAELCHGQSAVLKPRTTDRYGRTVGRVECDGVDASAEQVRSGMAWVFDRYVSDSALYEMQAVARGERRGLWGDAEPVAPWESRRAAR